jgi:Ca2+-binding RTX toxin-like protein
MARRKSAALVGAAAAALLAFPAAASADPVSNIAAGVLTVTGDPDDAIAITCAANVVQVNGAPVAGGGCDAITSIVVTGGSGANTIDLSGVEDADSAVNTDYPAITSVTIDGAAGDDTITGSEHTDTMRGGDGNDRIVGDQNKAPGSFDVFEGQGGNDTLVWNPGHDSDRMEGGDGADTIEMNGGGGPEQFTVKPHPTDPARVQFDRTGPTPPGPFTLDIGTAERLDFNAGDGDDTLASEAGLLALGFALDIDGGPGNDTLDGGDGADLMHGGDGSDVITPDDNPPLPGPRDEAYGDGGDDRIIWNGGEDDDLNEGGDGIDTIEVNGAGAPEAFTVKAAPGGRYAFDRLAAPGPGPFNIDIGTAELLDLEMGQGDDTLTADAGLDLRLEGGDGNDSADVDGSSAGERYTLAPAAGRVALERLAPTPYKADLGTVENLRLDAGDGNDKIKGAEGLAALIKSALYGDGGADRILGTDGEDTLAGGKGFDIINSRDEAEDTVDCAGGFDIAFVDRRDFLRGCEVVLGGAQRVKTLGKVAEVAGGSAAVRLRCVAAKRCKGQARLRRGGKTLAAGKFRMDRGKNRTVRLKLKQRGRKALAKAPANGMRAKLVVDSRDDRGNGWRTTARVRIAD